MAPTIDPDRSLAVHDPATLATPFKFRRTLQQIIDTSGNTATTPEALLQTMLDSFAKSSFVQPVSGKTIPVDPRPNEAALSATQLLDPISNSAMLPIGLFNRFDLAPANGMNCGEYRIVYGMKQPSNGRFLIIFESRLPNPNPASGLAGCQPVAKFWADLSTNPDATSRLNALDSFYYQGLTASGFGPVVTHANYGLPLGQVRTNLFVGFTVWMLREHRTSLDAMTGVPIFKVDTVKDSPLAEWFRDPSTLPSGLTAADQQAFRAHFLNQPTCNLLRPDRANPAATQFDVVNGIGGGFDPAGNDFQSVSQGLSDDPANATDPALNAAIAPRLSQLGVTTAGVSELLNRAGAMTCGGCHQFSSGRSLNSAGTITWPASAGFVQITEGGSLSAALTSFLLPRRQQILTRFVCDPTPEPQPSPDCPAPVAAPAGGAGMSGAAKAAGAALPSAEGLDPELIARLRSGRPAPYFSQVDAARVALLAAARRAAIAKKREGKMTAAKEVSQAAAILEAAVQQARMEEQALGGAFVAVRRTH